MIILFFSPCSTDPQGDDRDSESPVEEVAENNYGELERKAEELVNEKAKLNDPGDYYHFCPEMN